VDELREGKRMGDVALRQNRYASPEPRIQAGRWPGGKSTGAD